MSDPRIVISEVMDSTGLERLSAVAEVHYDPLLWKSPKSLTQAIQDADALVVRNQTRVTADVFAVASRLQVVGRLGVGLDNIDVSEARRRKVQVVSAAGANAVAVAEYVFACLLHFSRNLSLANQNVHGGEWDRTLGGFELYGKTLGLIGLGDIGQRIAFRARCFGMRVMANDPLLLNTRMAAMELGVELRPLDDVLGASDFISVHVPLTDLTRNLLSAGQLSRMKPGAYLINTARGGVVNESDLLAAVASGAVAGAALDVRTTEPSSPDDALCQEPRILLTPHIAGLTREAGIRTSMMVADDVIRVLSGEKPLSPV